MDKYVEVFCKQNPVMNMACGNSECGCEFEVKTKEFFKNKTYNHTCAKCEKSTDYDTSKFVTGLIQQLKKLGVEVR
ncbi:hypothetical protein [Clostridium sp. E02]|uniref:hypothetical protein n=1 Tax=Clostridium sp. E02 TaxID=2487134 RepID=UPI000F54AB71|nr:hypothetical protein [Clostridium sp. E02]